MEKSENFRNSKPASFSANALESTDEEEDEIQPEIDELLKIKVRLKDGSETYIFSRGPKQSEFKIWPVACHLCKKQFIRTINEPQIVLDHARTLHHKQQVKRAVFITPEKFSKPFQQNYPRDMCSFLNPIFIYPGEIITDVTTVYADRLVRIPPLHITSPYYYSRKELIKNDKIIAYNANLPLLGLNGIIKTRPFFNGFNIYYCTLCEGSEFYDDTCFQHIVGKKHTNIYIDKYFPKLKKKLNIKLSNLNPQIRSKYIYEIVRYIYFKLEGWKEKREFTFIDYNSWTTDRDKHLRYVRKSLYYHENIVKFSTEEINKLLNKLKNKEEIIPPDLEKLPNQLTSKDIEIFKSKYERTVSRHTSINHSIHSERSQEKMFEGNRLPTKERHFENNDKRIEKKIICAKEDWKFYRKKCEQKIRDIDVLYSGYIEKPDTHLNYKPKWEDFFKKRSQELKERGVDALSYDFAAEWKNYWIKNLYRYYIEEIDNFKGNLRKKLDLPRKENTPEYSSKGSLFIGLKIDNSDETIYNNTRKVVNNVKRHSPKVELKTQPQEKINVLYILRLLNAIEDQLGTFAASASQLLTEAILFERETKTCSNKLLEQGEYYKFFITTLERLKGLLQAELVIEPRIKAVNKAITCLDHILKEFDESNGNKELINNNYRSYISVSPSPQKLFPYESPTIKASTSKDNSFPSRRKSSNFSTKSIQKIQTPSPPQGFFTESSYAAKIRRTPPPPIGFFPPIHSPNNSPRFLVNRKRTISPQNTTYLKKRRSSNIVLKDENYQNQYVPFRNDSSKFGNRNPSPPNKRLVNQKAHSAFSRRSQSPSLNNLHPQRQNKTPRNKNSRWRYFSSKYNVQ